MGNLCVKHDVNVESFLPTIHGVWAFEIISKLNLPGIDLMTEIKELAQTEFDAVNDIESIYSAANFLNALSLERLVIVISAPRKLALRRLEATGLSVPPIMATGENFANGKPAPNCSLLSAQRLGKKSGNCLVFENPPAGVRTAEAAGANVLVINATHHHAGCTPHPSVPSYGALTSRFDSASRLTLARLATLQDAGD